MKKNNFNGKICWITGASSGIGKALAKSLSEQGASLVISARNEVNLHSVKSECANPSKVIIVPCNLEDTATIPVISKVAWDAFGKLDYVFLNAGIAVRDAVLNTEVHMISKVMNINFIGAAAIAKNILPLMVARGSGNFVVTSSLSGKYGIPKLSAYAASKHALHGYFGSLRAEHAKDGIQVIMVIPGLIRTGISLHALTGEGKSYGKMMESLDTGMSPEVCAEKILKGVLKGKNEIIVGNSEKISLIINRLFPTFMAWIIRNHPLEKLRKLGFVRRPHASI